MTNREHLERLVNELAFTLLMTAEDENDNALIEQFQDLRERIREDANHAPLVTACDEAWGALASLKGRARREMLETLIRHMQAYLHDPSSIEVIACTEVRNDEWHDNIVEEFLADFIEKYTGLLDDQEGLLVEAAHAARASSEGCSDVPSATDADVKSFLHTLKGDAGSIGLNGISKLCHHIEDVLGDAGTACVTDLLIDFMQWLRAALGAYAQGGAPTPSPKEFFSEFSSKVDPQHPTQVVKPAAPSASTEVQSCVPSELLHEFPEANESLLAELLEDEEFSDLLTAQAAREKSSDGETAPSEESESSSAESYTISGEHEILFEFTAEAEDHLATLESTVLDAVGSYSRDEIDVIFRGIHSIKGASAYFCLNEIAETSHHTESLLDEVRDGEREFDRPLSELVLSYVDLTRSLLDQAKKAAMDDGILHRNRATVDYLSALEAYRDGDSKTASQSETGSAEMPEEAAAAPAEFSGEPEAVPSTEQVGQAPQKRDKLDIKTFVKVETRRLDELVDSIGEMVIYSSMLIQHCRDLLPTNEQVMKISHQVESFSRDLQDLGMSMRLIPIKGLFQKMSRIVWDTARKMGKDIQFTMEGEDTELDRTIIDKLADPLMHMVRNALDHGIESSEQRTAAGKNPQGHIRLKACHSGGSIHISIEDDGRGLDPAALRKKAVEKGIIREDQPLSEQETFQLIFAAGFSTAAQVTDISGRGVGMDVVRRNIESMRGRVRIDSAKGRGSSFIIELPLTLAIIDGTAVSVGREHYIIPSLSVITFVRPQPGAVSTALRRGEMFSFRGSQIPVYRLGELFGINSYTTNVDEAILVVVESDGMYAALMVDDIVGTYSTVIKSIGSMFRETKGVAGCAIVASGEVALILDVRSLLALAKKEYLGIPAAGHEVSLSEV